MRHFIQIHALLPLTGLINRGEDGQAKRRSVGGTSRIRISSQSLKYAWRNDDGPHALKNIGELSVRSRHTFEQLIVQKLLDKKTYAEGTVREVVETIAALVLGESIKAKKEKEAVALASEEKKKAKKAKDEGPPSDKPAQEEDFGEMRTEQVVVLGPQEIAYLLTVCEDICKQIKAGNGNAKSLTAGKRSDMQRMLPTMSAGLDAAMFGRMTTGDLLTHLDSAAHVMHAFTVHEEMAEADFFSAKDQLNDVGTGHINAKEFTANLFYAYVCVDVEQLLTNINGTTDKTKWKTDVAKKTITSLMHLISKTSPGAQKGSTAPYGYAPFLMVEAGDQLPCNLELAFYEPVSTKGNLLKNTYDAIANYLEERDAMYGKIERRSVGMFIKDFTKESPNRKPNVLGDVSSLEAMCAWACSMVDEAKAGARG